MHEVVPINSIDSATVQTTLSEQTAKFVDDKSQHVRSSTDEDPGNGALFRP